ncbi:FAD-linked oxidase C-terminal domain-containing protein [Microbacterium sp. M3]|uniref:FAD-linked oxidase C-terminal domain-containing protein n=1 Tax=Microbacterium arthrosphaerae TaxID=792652 RepID=A0ABU4GXZ2_9MICO|nr:MULTISPECIES: FAD-linked oxidase C-terminal domain-containing protein [Microbacterium]MDW4571319.1 FAD-linked oxidase C-terminal domain-containing protein [Microbacterium arthrosphaerae]MDW7605174.1 FAD-linked oxidase C-terminal domain-containing protein [Microbacterium sp. M3]
MDTVVDALRAVLPPLAVATDAETLARHSHDDAEWAPYGLPAAVVFASRVDDVVATVRIAAERGVPVVPRGAGTGLSGGANATSGCLVLSLERMTRIVEVDAAERYAVVEAGVLNDDLRRHVAGHGLWYPPDPASQAISTIGGNVATNAGGICCVKYGVTRDYVLGMTVVLADGSIAKLGRTTAKGVTGYDLTGLLVGSEGTLAIIVDVTVRLLPLGGRQERAVVGYFRTLTDAGAAVAAVTRAGIVPSALELIDRTCLHAVAQWQGWDLPEEANALLLAKVDEPGERGEELAAALAGLFRDAGGDRVERAADPAEIDRLFAARRLAYPALERLGPVLTEDVCVPRRAVPEMLARIEAVAAEAGVVIANIAHAGDGNLHPLIIAPEGDDEAKARAKVAFDRIVDACRSLGGTVTGEHGVGLLKLPGAAAELSPVVRGLHRAVKHALDPAGILNPGKAFPDGESDALDPR